MHFALCLAAGLHLFLKNNHWFYSIIPGEEPTYAGVPMSTIVERGYGVGDVISLLWFKRSLPRYCTKFIEVWFLGLSNGNYYITLLIIRWLCVHLPLYGFNCNITCFVGYDYGAATNKFLLLFIISFVFPWFIRENCCLDLNSWPITYGIFRSVSCCVRIMVHASLVPTIP